MDRGAEFYRSFLQGNENSLDEIIRIYRDGLVLYINSIVKDITLAEDVAEDTFVKLFVKRPHFRDGASFKTFLYTIGRNTALNALKKRVIHVPVDECEDLASDAESIEDIIIREEREKTLLTEIAALKPDYSQALWLVYYEQMSVRDAAEVIGKSVHATEMILSRARKELKTKLTEGGFDI